jgi:cell fate (sporulation/competence/biofilm development) regulator YmcA (YheA/YmcA/DUF963 family)
MEKSLNKEIENKLNEIIDYIENTDSYKNYLKSREKLEQNPQLITLIETIKKLQQQLVKNPSKKCELDKKINEYLDILQSNPTYLEYTEYLEDVNNMLNIFENKINKYFYDIFN